MSAMLVTMALPVPLRVLPAHPGKCLIKMQHLVSTVWQGVIRAVKDKARALIAPLGNLVRVVHPRVPLVMLARSVARRLPSVLDVVKAQSLTKRA